MTSDRSAEDSPDKSSDHTKDAPSDAGPDPSDIFDCRRCGECCRGYGGTYVTPDDILAIAEYLGSDPDRFVADYCQMSGTRPVLGLAENGFCVFWKDKICGIHPVKPRMCRAWPFIESVLTDVTNWRVMSGMCSGIRTDASDADIVRCVRRVIESRREKRQEKQ